MGAVRVLTGAAVFPAMTAQYPTAPQLRQVFNAIGEVQAGER